MSSLTKLLGMKNGQTVVTHDDLPARDQTLSRLRISELRYRRLFEAARDGILILDAVTLKITDANPFMTELLGYSQVEFLGKELWEIGLFSDKEASQEAFKELQRTGYLRYEDLPLQATNGRLREVEFVSNVYEEDSHQVIQCNIRDITDRRRAEKERTLLLAAAQSARVEADSANGVKDEFLPPCRMNCGLLSPRSSAGHICSPKVSSINSRLLGRSKPSLATLELKAD